jgi:osmotically-inducible protein OsmY
MWNVNPDKDKSTGGFQNRDVGKTQFDKNYGPDYGVDYARFSDPPDIQKDLELKKLVEESLLKNEHFRDISPTVRNGFVILKGNVPDHQIRDIVVETVRGISGVVEVINQVKVSENLQ